jgi:hypothetical protein
MKTYTFRMTRVYETIIEIEAENHNKAFEKLDELGDMIYTIELEQCCIIDAEIKLEKSTNKT